MKKLIALALILVSVVGSSAPAVSNVMKVNFIPAVEAPAELLIGCTYTLPYFDGLPACKYA